MVSLSWPYKMLHPRLRGLQMRDKQLSRGAMKISLLAYPIHKYLPGYLSTVSLVRLGHTGLN
jgi:hypothetical protein